MSQAFVFQLNLKIRKTNIKAQKINSITLETYQIVVSIFSVLDKDNKMRFFKQNFLLTDIKPDIILEMLFLFMSNADVNFKT